MRETSHHIARQDSQQPKHFRGDEQKVMKKSLSLLLAIAMVFSMFAAMASAADNELTTQQKFDVLMEAGIFEGYPPNNDPGLDREMTRAEFAKILALLTDAPSNASAATYTDVPATHWAAEYIGAVSAAGLMNGVGQNKFDPNAKVSVEMVAITVVRALGLDETTGTLTGTYSPWAEGFIIAAQQAGMPIVGPNYKANALRTVLVDNAYTLWVLGSVEVSKVEVVDANNIKVTFKNGDAEEVVDVALETALVPNQATNVTVKYQGVDFVVSVNLEQAAFEANATGAKLVEVKFNKAVDDTKAKFTIKKGSADVAVAKTTFAADKKSAVIELSSKLTAGDYVVSATGVETEALTDSFTAENERIETLAFNSDKLALANQEGTRVSVTFKITNQYGEDITSAFGGQVNFSTSKGSINNSNGRVTLTAPGTSTYVINEPVLVSGIHQSTGKTLSATLTVGPQAIVDTITVKELYHPEGKTISAGANFGEFVLLIDAVDQYGNKVGAAEVNRDVFINVTNPQIFQIATTAIDNQGKDRNSVGVRLAAPIGNTAFEGTNTVRFMTKLTAKTTNFEVVVNKGTALQSVSLEQPANTVAAGDETTRIPFTAVDGLGNPITKFADLRDKVTLSASNDTGTEKKAVLKEDLATKNAYIEWQVPAVQGSYSITAVTTGTFQPSSLIITVAAPATPTTVDGTKDITLNTVATAATTDFVFSPSKVVVKDQYGRDFKLNDDKFFDEGFRLEFVTNANPEVAIGTIDSEGDTVTVQVAGENTVDFKIKLVSGTGANLVVHNSKDVSVSTVANSNLRNYQVKDTGKLYNATTHAKDVKVVATDINGREVEIPSSQYTVNTPDQLVFANGKISVAPNAVTFAPGETEKTYNFTVVFNVNNVSSITKSVVVTNVAPQIQKVVFKDNLGNGGLKGEGNVVTGPAANVTVAKIMDAFRFVDQYGHEYDPATIAAATTVSVTKVTGAEVGTTNPGPATQVTLTNVQANAQIEVSFVYNNFTINLTVKAN
ncbi:hypothetical protein PA598K_04773 [Paenibacillus sp. 598K]|uniref:S-layer homology domain-containing protein n=1 Tax=Paenibacillus sp. 598K TaxID=1117987 RepID=UPI000FF9A497|nr:S-layer homology domain-containing protein [Paenibacillus sp. 598K]GBF76314.1 hypothetical protein PA598K_04773 [Paenibacillus sp. 598K]